MSAGVGYALEQCRSDHVDTLVGALRRQNHRYQQVERSVVVELGLSHRHFVAEYLKYAAVALFCGHYGCLDSRMCPDFIFPEGQKSRTHSRYFVVFTCGRM